MVRNRNQNSYFSGIAPVKLSMLAAIRAILHHARLWISVHHRGSLAFPLSAMTRAAGDSPISVISGGPGFPITAIPRDYGDYGDSPISVHSR
jgi:hypothetical protein